MILKTSPFDEIAFTKETKMLLDACILLSLTNEDDVKHVVCKEEIDKITKQESRFYTSNVILAEVINRTIYRLFVQDIQNVVIGKEYLNSQSNLSKILTIFNNHDLDILFNENSSKKAIDNINYSKYFNLINKRKTSIDRDVLQIYFTETIKIISDLENDYDLKILVINENMTNMSKVFLDKYMLGINDSQHIATAIGYRMHYLVSTDGDFNFINEDLKVEFLKIS